MSAADPKLTIRDAAEQIEAALRLPDPIRWRIYTDPGANIQTPAVVIGPPELDFQDYRPGAYPTQARFKLYLIVDANARTLETLWDLVPEVSAIVDEYTDGVVTIAMPATFVAPTGELPSYEITVEVPL